jgi:hypothetical protein
MLDSGIGQHPHWQMRHRFFSRPLRKSAEPSIQWTRTHTVVTQRSISLLTCIYAFTEGLIGGDSDLCEIGRQFLEVL